jgi:hypothetical protein
LLLAVVLFALIAKIGTSVVGPFPFGVLCVVVPSLLILCAMLVPLFVQREVTVIVLLLVMFAVIHAAPTVTLLELDWDENLLSGLAAILVPTWCVIVLPGELVGYNAEELIESPMLVGVVGSLLYAAIGFLSLRTCAAASAGYPLITREINTVENSRIPKPPMA